MDASGSAAIDSPPDDSAMADSAASGAEDTSVGPNPGADSADGSSETSYVMYVTFYGWDDNSPPGDDIAYPMNGGYPTVHDVAGGTGTYADPLTMATDSAELPIGTFVYLPFCQKYAVMEDDCVECDSDWSTSMTRHIDVWMNSNGTESASALTDCEAQWTQNATTVRVDPPADLPVVTTPLFDPATNTCAPLP